MPSIPKGKTEYFAGCARLPCLRNRSEQVNNFVQSMIPELTELTFYYMNLVTVSRVQRNPTVKAEIQMRNFEASIPVGFSVIQSVRRLISRHSVQLPFLSARISFRCLNNARRLFTSSIPFTAKLLRNRRLFFRATRLVCDCPVLTARQR